MDKSLSQTRFNQSEIKTLNPVEMLSLLVIVSSLLVFILNISIQNYNNYQSNNQFNETPVPIAPTEKDKTKSKLAKYEPEKGCYLGAYIDFDGTLNDPYQDQNGVVHNLPRSFDKAVGKPHAMYFFYLGYGSRLPMDWVKLLAKENKFVHIALEPNGGLDEVTDGEYMLKLADDMRKSGAKIFLRFASEMNGSWVKYNGNPKKYIEKFRLVHLVMEKRAPNVAMVWCPFAVPANNVDAYYPGDDYVDWVGVNFYNVTFHNNSIKQPAEHEDPIDFLRPIYTKYSSRKPIMICEYGATHRSAVDDKIRSDFAIAKINRLYNALPIYFKRVKCINYFDGNNFVYALPGRRLNDYSLTNNDDVLSAYKQVISNDWYLGEPVK